MIQTKTCFDLEGNALTNFRVQVIEGLLVQRREGPHGSYVGVIGELVGLPFVLIRYHGEDDKVVRAELIIEGEYPGCAEQTIKLFGKVKSNSERCKLIPFFRRTVNRIETLCTAARFRPIPGNLQPELSLKVAKVVGFDPKKVVFDS